MKWKLSLLRRPLNSATGSGPPAGGRGESASSALLSFRSEWSRGCRIRARLEVRPRPDVALFFSLFVCSSLQCWLCHRWDCPVSVDGAGHVSDGENRNPRTFVLFLVQYAVHKSLALQTLRFLLVSFVDKWVHCWFSFSIKSLWTTERSCVFHFIV